MYDGNICGDSQNKPVLWSPRQAKNALEEVRAWGLSVLRDG